MPSLLAVLVDGEQLAQGAEARRLRVDRPRLSLQRLDVGQRVQRRVPGDPVGVRLEHRPGLVVQVGVLEIGRREGLGDGAVELGVGLHVDRGTAVVPLQIEDVDARDLRQLRDQLGVPVVLGVELEAQARVLLEPPANRLGGGAGVVVPEAREAGGADEGHGLRVAAERLVERDAALAERQVERCALVRPAAVVARGLAHRRRRAEEVELREQLAELAQGPRAAQVVDGPGVAMGDVVEDVVDDVLADPLLSCATEPDDRRWAGEGAVLAVVALELIRGDLDRQVGECLERAHRSKASDAAAKRSGCRRDSGYVAPRRRTAARGARGRRGSWRSWTRTPAPG